MVLSACEKQVWKRGVKSIEWMHSTAFSLPEHRAWAHSLLLAADEYQEEGKSTPSKQLLVVRASLRWSISYCLYPTGLNISPFSFEYAVHFALVRH